MSFYYTKLWEHIISYNLKKNLFSNQIEESLYGDDIDNKYS